MSLATPDIRLLGRFLVVRAGEEVPVAAFGGRKVRLLIRVLAVRRGLHVSHDALAGALWPQRAPADPSANIGVLVNRARRALGDAALISTTPGGYALTGRCEVDAERFAEGVAAARVAPPGQALRHYVAALDQWTGEPLAEDVDADWARSYRDRLERLHHEATEEAAAVALDLGESTLAVSLASAAVATEPLREAGYVLLARALALAGDRAAAIGTLDSLRQILADELGIDPSSDVDILRTSLLGGPTPQRPVRPTATRARARVELPFVGRAAQLAELLRTVRSDVDGDGAAAVVGPAGAGKSRLLAEVAARTGIPVAAARAFLPERAESWTVARSLLSEVLALDSAFLRAVPRRSAGVLADLLPEQLDAEQLDADKDVRLDARTRRALIVEGGLRLLSAAADADVLVIVDDLQWADPSSLALLATALDRLPQLRAVFAYRPAGAYQGADVGAALVSQRAIRTVELPPLSPDDLAELADDALADALHAATDGSPFAVAEVLGGLAERGELRESGGRWRSGSRSTVELAAELGRAGRRRSVRTRALAHTPDERDVLGLLVVAARPVPARTVAQAVGQPESKVLDTLLSLSRGGLVQLGEQGWTTSHDLVRETIADHLTADERGRLHGRLAAGLSAEGADPAELARHHSGAGDADTAAACYAAAARSCLDRYADAEAAELTAAGLALPSRAALRQELLDVRAQVRARQGDLVGARCDMQELLAATERGARRSQLLSRQAVLYSGAEDLHRAAALAEAAVVEAGADAAATAQALETAAILDMNLDRPDRARERAERALALYVELGDGRGTARITDGRAMAVFLDGQIEPAIDLFGRVASLFTDSGDLLRAITPLSTLGHALVFHAEPAAGLTQIEAALDLARSLGYLEGQTYTLWHRAEALVALERADEAIHCGLESVDIAQRIGHRGWSAAALRGLGMAHAARGEPDAALAAFDRALATSDRLPVFASWAASQAALTLVAIGDVERAAGYVERALGQGPPLVGYEARLAAVELAAARAAPDAASLAAHAVALATAGGHLASLARLAKIADGATPGHV